MAVIELRRPVDGAGAAAIEALLGEYVDWVVEQLWSQHGLRVGAGGAAQVNDAFRAEWPKLLGPRGRLYLALVDGAPAGMAALKPVTMDDSELKRIYVRPAHRGLGLARRLVEQVIDDARSLGYRRMRLESLDFMRPAHALYRSLGFVDTDRFEGFEGDGRGVEAFELFMILDLTAG
jgi:GNAT superfamily N-acetyltransferase